jgi:hypothetical protein
MNKLGYYIFVVSLKLINTLGVVVTFNSESLNVDCIETENKKEYFSTRSGVRKNEN